MSPADYKTLALRMAAFCARLHGRDEDVPRDVRDEAMRHVWAFKEEELRGHEFLLRIVGNTGKREGRSP